jgi:hypothetical protein
MLGERKTSECGRTDRERMHGRTNVVHKARQSQLSRTRSAAIPCAKSHCPIAEPD